MSDIKPIETVYNGYRFRSRLEARWAVFFDALGVKYQYEPEGFDLGGVWYLPDFWITNWDCWVEIKPDTPRLWIRKDGQLVAVVKTEYRSCETLSRHSKKPVLLIGGTPWINPPIAEEYYSLEESSEYGVAIFLPDMIADDPDCSETGIGVKIPWPSSEFSPLYEDFYTSSARLYGFIYDMYRKTPGIFDKPLPSRGDALGLIEADKTCFRSKHNRPHWKWEYGVADSGFIFSSARYDQKLLRLEKEPLIEGVVRSDLLNNAYTAARQARFEKRG